MREQPSNMDSGFLFQLIMQFAESQEPEALGEFAKMLMLIEADIADQLSYSRYEFAQLAVNAFDLPVQETKEV